MRYLIFVLSFLIVAFGQPAWIEGFGVLAASLGYAIFWKGLLEFPKLKDRFLIATIFFASVQGIQLSWLATPDYMGPFIIPFYIFLILGMGLQFGIISSFIQKSLTWHKCLSIAGGWVLCEGMRLFFLCGCTWNPVGLSLVCNSYSLQFASIWGIFGLSFWVILVNLAFLKKNLTAWSVLALLPYLFGFFQQTWIENTVPISKKIEVALIQTDLAPEEKEFDAKLPMVYIHPLDQWKNIIKVLKGKDPLDLIVLPEAAVPLGAHTASYDLESVKRFLPEEYFPPFKRPYAIFCWDSWKVSNAFIAQTLANQMNAEVILGLDDKDLTGKYNAAFHFLPGNRCHKRYEKQILAPIGEYIPLGGLKWFSDFVAKEFKIYSSFDHGKEGKVFDSHVPIGISICLEETFPSLMRELRVKGAELFVSVSNDAYFPKTKLGQQHFDHGRVRAAENGIALLRSCNSGVTAGVDCFGVPLHILKTNEKTDALVFSFPVRSYKTLYTFWGDTAIFMLSFFFICTFLVFIKEEKVAVKG